MAQTNVQAFSGDVEISSNLAVDTNTLFVDSVGNKVGVGTSNPKTAGINVVGSFLAQGGASTVFSHNLYYNSGWKYASANNGGGYMRIVDSEVQFWNAPNSGSEDAAATVSQRMTIDVDGNVGIGVTDPSSNLHVANTSRAQTFNIDGTVFNLARKNNGNGVTMTSYDDFTFFVNGTAGTPENGTNALYIKNNGNVGINQSSPTQKLDVNGYANIGNTCIKTGGPFGSGTGGVYTGINLNGGTGGGVVLFFVSINSSNGTASAAWVFAIRKYYGGLGSTYPYPYYSQLYGNGGAQTPSIILYSDSGGVLKYTFGQNRNTKWSAIDI